MALEGGHVNTNMIMMKQTHFSLPLLSVYNQFSSFWETISNFDKIKVVSPGKKKEILYLEFLTPK